ncbi:MAG TPA: DUF362 domain-containing protein [bacterium]|nr:DUF362 domain-containing protein [bacterium]HPN45407.1 DUF362 domain-containing protein [bacterium]
MEKRRQFIKKTMLVGGALLLGRRSATAYAVPGLTIPSNTAGQKQSRVVIAHRNDLRTSQNLPDEAAVQKLLDTALENLFQQNSQNIWRYLFKPEDIVGLKVNCLAGKGLSTRPELVNAVVERLIAAGVNKSNIIIWDRHDNDLLRAGYTLYQGRQKVQCFGNNRVGFSQDIAEYGQIGSLLTRIVTEMCTALINLPILKDHGIVGLSAGMKNNFGVINNPNKYHDNIGDPFVADVNMLPPIRNKTRLIICDAITAQYEGGPPFMPQWCWNMDSLVVATDIVALDQVCWDIVETKRKAEKLFSLKQAGREPRYIATAADQTHRLGTNDLEKIECVRV